MNNTENKDIITFKKERWLHLSLFCIINFTTGALYVWSVFADALAIRLSAISDQTLVATDLGVIFGLATGITPLMMLLGGFVNDRLGPKWMLTLGGILLLTGYTLTALVTHSTSLYLTYGLLVGSGTGLVNGCTINSAVKFFPDRRGFASGLVTACLGIGAAILPFVARFLIDRFDICVTLLTFGWGSGLLILICAFQTTKCPDTFANAFSQHKSNQPTHTVEMNWRQMIGSSLFIPLFILFSTSATMGLMLLSNISSIAKTQIGLGSAMVALSISAIALANTSGRFISGVCSDLLGRLPTLIGSLIIALAGFGLLSIASLQDTLYYFTGIICIGLCFGAFIGIYPSLVADEFGAKNNSVNCSIMMFGYSVGGLVGPLLIQWAHQGGNFTRAYFVCVCLAFLGIFCALLTMFLKRQQDRTHVSLS